MFHNYLYNRIMFNQVLIFGEGIAHIFPQVSLIKMREINAKHLFNIAG